MLKTLSILIRHKREETLKHMVKKFNVLSQNNGEELIFMYLVLAYLYFPVLYILIFYLNIKNISTKNMQNSKSFFAEIE